MLRRTGVATNGAQRAAQAGPMTEMRLLARIADRDLRAFEDLYRLYHPRLNRFLIQMTRRAHLVEEILDDTMMVVWNKPGGFNGASKLSTWIFGIAYRKAQKAMRRSDEAVEDPAANKRPTLEAGPDQQLEQQQTREVILQALGELSADHRAVVDLAYFHEAGYREIAEIMDCPVDTVKTRMFHARRRLREKLAGELTDWL